MEITEVVTPGLMGRPTQAATYAASNEHVPAPSHTIILNVPGPQIPLYMAGAKVHMMMGMGPIASALGLFHVVLSCTGKITITFCCCKKCCQTLSITSSACSILSASFVPKLAYSGYLFYCAKHNKSP